MLATRSSILDRRLLPQPTIQVEPYDPAWADTFLVLAEELTGLLAGVGVLSLEHVGSTAVPGLAAKPIIDVDVVVEADDVAPAVRALEWAGYGYRGTMEVPDRHVIRSPPGEDPRQHVYVVVAESLALRNHLTVRRVLRENSVIRSRYAKAKRTLAANTSSGEEYTTGKTGIIDEILRLGGLPESERASIRLIHEVSRARRTDANTVVTDDGTQLWVEVSGDPDGAPVLLCHGGPGVGDYLEELRDLLVGLGTRVVRWDQRGAGRSTRQGPFSLERFVADLEAVRRTVAGQQCWVVGHSWGANLALAHAWQYSHHLRGVAYLCGTGLEWWPDYSRRHKDGQQERLGAELGTRLAELRTKERTVAEEEEFQLLYLRSELADTGDTKLARRLVERDRRHGINYKVNAAINDELKTLSLGLQQSRCLAVTVPVVVVSGEHEPRPTAALDSMIESLPLTESIMIRDAGHWPWLEAPDQMVELIGQFLDSTTMSR